MTRRVEAVLLLVVFVALLLVGLRVTSQVAVESPGIPPEMRAIGSRVKVIAWAQILVGLLGAAGAIGVFRGARWAYVGVAWLLTAVAVVAVLAKTLAGPAMRVDPPWSLVVVVAGLAALAWRRIHAVPRDA